MNGIFEHTVTVYNRRFAEIINPPFPPARRIGFERTVIKGVMWKDRSHAETVSDGATVIERTVSVTIPLEADQSGKEYIRPAVYAEQDEGKYWTIGTDAANSDIIVLGEGPEINEIYTVENLERDFKHMRPRAVKDSSGQNVLPQWKAEGV